MSFDYNPLQHIEVVKVDNGSISVHCHGCGWDSTTFPDTIPIKECFDVMRVLMLKNLTKELMLILKDGPYINSAL